MSLPREKATHAADLPHEFAGDSSRCELCGQFVHEARHLAWERANDATDVPATLPRETGV